MSGAHRPSQSPSGFQVIFERPDQPSQSPPAGEPAFRPRRYHTKSRNGCFNCKRRRIKCDEAQPECSHCWEKSLQCEYPSTARSPQPRQSSIPSPTRSSSRSRQSSDSLRLSDPRIRAILDADDVPGDAAIAQGYERPDVFDLLHHFVIPTDRAWIGAPYSQGLVQEHVRRDAGTAPYLLYSALAFSAAHMQYLESGNTKYRVAAPYHYQHSLRRYSDKLSGALEDDDADSLFVSCQLHAFLAFWNAPSAHDSTRGVDLGWVRSMRGIRFITQSPQLMASLQRGPFSPVIQLTRYDWRGVCQQAPLDNNSRVEADLRQLQALEHLCAGVHPDHRATLLQSLTMLRDLACMRPTPNVAFTFMIWVNRQPSAFIDLLEVAEPVALLAIGMWCALFSRVDEWWIVAPARAECGKICAHVGGLGETRYQGVVAYLRSFS